MKPRLIAIVCCCAMSAVATDVAAQVVRPVHRVELSGGGGLLGGGDVGSAEAALRANGLTPSPYRLFETETRFGAAPNLEARAGVDLSRRIGVEVRFGFNRPELRTSVSADAENGPAVTVTERVDQYVIDAGVVVMLDELRVGGMIPFAAAGGGYLRQLHEGLTLVEHGQSYYVGGGVKRWLFARGGHLIHAAGVRGDARLYLVAGGIRFDDGARPSGAISGSFFVTF